MSPPADHGPRTPDRRSSSSALLGAFRSLTGGRLKSPTPPPSATSATYTPARSSSLAESLASPTASSADGSLKRISAQIGPKHARPVLGGPPELDGFVEQLDRKRPFPERAVAVDSICNILDEYMVENVLHLWSRASDMLLPEQPDDVAESGYRLLRHCVGLPKLSVLERNVLFDAASLRKNDRSFDKRLDIVATLTKRGRNVQACESSLAHFILTSLDACFKQSVAAYRASRKAGGSKKSAEPIPELENLAQLFQYTIDVCKFNSKVFSDDDLELLLSKVVTICQETTQSPDIENAIRLFNTVITYGHLPKPSLRPCLEVLCAVHRQLPSLQDQTWHALANLFKSHVGQVAVSALLRVLSDGPVRKNRKSSAYRGTIQVLQQLLLENGRNGLPVVPMPLLFSALKASIQQPHKTQEEYVIKVVDAILADDSLRDLLLSEVDWTELLDIIQTCAERADERIRAQSERSTDERAAPTNASVSRNTVTNGASSVASNGDGDGEAISNLDLAAPTPRLEVASRHSEDRIFKVLSKLDNLSEHLDFVQKDAVMELSMRLAHRLSDSTAENVINYYVDERYLHPSNGNWLEACRSMVSGLIKDSTRPRSLRIMAIRALRETYNTVEMLCASDAVLQCGALLLNNIDAEEDVSVLHELVDFSVDVADRALFASFPDTVELLKRRMQRTALSQNYSGVSTASLSSSFQLDTDRVLGSPCNVIATAFVRLFIRSVKQSARKTRLLYETLRHVVGSERYESDARLTVLRLLFRLRADSAHALYVSCSSEGESLAAVLCRTEETATTISTKEDTVAPDQSRHEEQSPSRDHRKVSGGPFPSLIRHSGRHHTTTGRVSKPVPPLWMYPGPKGLPEEPSSDVSRVVFSHVDPEHYPLSEDILDMEVTLWLELAISILQKSSDWEVYSYVLVHLGPQLSNQSLVRSCVLQLKMLRNVICEQIRNSSFQEPPSHTLLKKADVAVCLFHILTVLISYHDHFEKSEEDDLVKAFIHGIGNWDRTSKWCIHALSVCCHELPLSVSKSLDTVIQKMSQIVTKPATAIHILDFLTSLARMPELFKNFREDDFKMVFGVSFRYLQHIRDQRERTTSSNSQSFHRSLRHSGPSRELAASPDHGSKKKRPLEDDLPQYLYSLAYHVIAFWFMGLKMEDRPKLMPWIARSLRFTDGMGRQTELEEQGQVVIDMMNLVCYSDRDETIGNPNFAKPGDGEVWKKSWVVGHSLVTIETAARTGVSQITNRRPCATRCLSVRPLLAPPPRHQAPLTVGLASEAYYSSSYVGILPDDIFQTFYASLTSSHDPPIALPDNDIIRRAITTFDRISTVDSYKVGVIYIGDGQTDEREMLMNDIGPPAYTSFLNDLGTLCRLKGAKFNTGGLDTRDDQDGEFTYAWRDRCIELVFHITTMMPTNPQDEMTYPNKKRHIGNDFVNIIYNDSGLPYNFDTFPSAFNYVYIVISPESRASFVDRRLDSDPDGKDRYYKVQVMSKPGFPDISPAAETKIVAGKHLAVYCRLIAINACVFSSVWFIKDGGESVSSWRNRLREIQRLRDRYGASEPHPMASSSPLNDQQGLSSPSSRENNLTSQFKRTSVVAYVSESTNRSSVTSSSHD